MLIPMLFAAAIALPSGPALTDAIGARDREFFALFFEGCDPAKLATMVAPDFEMYHDKGGRVATSGTAFVADYAKQCAARKQPDAWRSRRALVQGSLRVFPVPGYGAIEEGTHEFWERQGDGPEKKVGWARFVQVWRLDGSNWQLARVLSYDHKALDK